LTLSAWQARSLETDARRTAARFNLEWRNEAGSLRAGLTHARDESEGSPRETSLLELSASRRFLSNRVELGALSSVPVARMSGARMSGARASGASDLQERHRLSVQFSPAQWLTTFTGIEYRPDDSRPWTMRSGLELRPWQGANLKLTSINAVASQPETDTLSIAAGQSVQLTAGWSLDFNAETNRSMGSSSPTTTSLSQALPSGEAASLGVNYRGTLWSHAARLEGRENDANSSWSATLATLLRQTPTTAVGAFAQWSQTNAEPLTGEPNGGPTTALTDNQEGRLEVSWAWRPNGEAFAVLQRLEARASLNNDRDSVRLINSVSAAWTPEVTSFGLARIGVFWGARYASEQFGDVDAVAFTNLLGLDTMVAMNQHISLGFLANVRADGDGVIQDYALGPQINVIAAPGALINLGYNIIGFEDTDFGSDRRTRAGAYLGFRLKFDQSSADSILGLLQAPR
jgi:hypothetical protein